MIKDLKIKTVSNIRSSLENLGINHDEFMIELSKYNGCIAGSFVFMNFGFSETGKNFLGFPKEFNDIDVYIHYTDIEFGPVGDDPFKNFHPFELFIMNKYTIKHENSNSYIFTDGIYHSRTYDIGKVKINIITLSMDAKQFIEENFDLDCCKITYDGELVECSNIDNLLKGTTYFRYNKCSLGNIYKNGLVEKSFVHNSNSEGKTKYSLRTNPHNLYASEAFLKFINIYKIYRNTYHNNTYQISEQFKRYYNYMEMYFDFESIFGNLTLDEVKTIAMTDDIVKIISRIRTFERIDKYKARGIRKVLYKPVTAFDRYYYSN